MKIVYFQSGSEDFRCGVWFYRQIIPAKALRKRGHEIKMAVLTNRIDEWWYKFPDVVIFRNVYLFDPVSAMRELKRRGKRIVYDIDDDFWTINPDNPAAKTAKEKVEQITALLKEADIVTTTTEVLKQRLSKFNKNIAIVPNALDFTEFCERPKNEGLLKVGYTGGASHWGDLEMVANVIGELQKKYKFKFVLQGITGDPLINEIYTYRYYLGQGLQPEKNEFYEAAMRTFEKLRRLNYIHIPWYHPELYPPILVGMDWDIGLCPLKDNSFNQAKSCVKFYEYAAVGTTCLASDVLPYKNEVNYRAKNTFKDWYKKLEKLIKDEKFREKITEKQWEFVEKNRNIEEVILQWEKILGYVGSQS